MRSDYQNKLIANYYDNLHKAMLNLKIPPAIVSHIMEKRSVEILAKNLQDWLKQKKKK
jgi:hypothetical protein